MSFEELQIVDKSKTDVLGIKLEFMNYYHQQGFRLNKNNQGIDFFFGENNNCHQVGSVCLEFE